MSMQGRYRVPALEIDDGQVGDLYRIELSPDGRPVLYRIPIPSDWATVSYVLGISGGLPVWLPAGEGAVLAGFGNSYGNDFGGPP